MKVGAVSKTSEESNMEQLMRRLAGPELSEFLESTINHLVQRLGDDVDVPIATLLNVDS